MRTREQDVEPFVNLSELTEIELLILKRMREFTIGEHRSVFHGHGFDFVGLRDWAPGDRLNQVDFRFAKILRFDRSKLALNLDLYNALNVDTVLTLNNAYATWQRPQAIILARFAKIGVQFDF